MNKQITRFLLPLLAVLCFITAAPAHAADEPKGLNDYMISKLADLADKEKITFVYISDMHVPFEDRGTVGIIATAVNKLMPDFVLTGGDNVQVGNDHNFNALKKAIKKFKFPIICAIGNHDTAFEDYAQKEEWAKRFGRFDFYFDAGPGRFVVLDNANYTLRDDQLDYLEKALDFDGPKFVAMHRPLNYLNEKYGTAVKGFAAERFRQIVEDAGVTAVLMGHEHHFGHYEVGGVDYFVAAGAGGMLNTNTENNFHHYLIIRFDSESFEFEVVKI